MTTHRRSELQDSNYKVFRAARTTAYAGLFVIANATNYVRLVESLEERWRSMSDLHRFVIKKYLFTRTTTNGVNVSLDRFHENFHGDCRRFTGWTASEKILLRIQEMIQLIPELSERRYNAKSRREARPSSTNELRMTEVFSQVLQVNIESKMWALGATRGVALPPETIEFDDGVKVSSA